jgi:hypothetical protein
VICTRPAGPNPTNGLWLLEGAVNGSSSDGYVFQRISNAVPGSEYTFSAWVMTGMRENNNWKYDVWQMDQRLIYMRIGIDPTGRNDEHGGKLE